MKADNLSTLPAMLQSVSYSIAEEWFDLKFYKEGLKDSLKSYSNFLKYSYRKSVPVSE